MRLEESLQMHIIRWFDEEYPTLSPLLIHVPNGGYRSKTEAVRLKQAGVRAGVADLIFLRQCVCYSALFIELKTSRGKLSEQQKAWLTLAKEESGGVAVVARSVAVAKGLLTAWVDENILYIAQYIQDNKL